MTLQSRLEQRLFRLCIVLKVAFWAALAAMLVKGIWTAAAGHALVPPWKLILVVAALLLLQLGAWIAWWLARRARQRRTGQPGGVA